MSWISPFSLPGSWFKGNLHTHTTQSDGLLTPDQAANWYCEQGYDFLAITDHRVLTPGKTTRPDFITVTGTELDGPGYHLLALGISALPDDHVAESPQAVTEFVRAQGGMPFFAHPYWSGQTSAEIAAVQGIMGLEVYNSICDKMVGLGYARVHWDDLLAQGARLTGLAVDDVHWRHEAQGRGFIMVQAERLEETHILEAIRKGHFYASMGPTIQDLRVVRLGDHRRALRVHCSACSEITFFACGPLGHRFEAPAGGTLTAAAHPLSPEQVYLRVECRDAQGRIAWSNPVYTEDVLE